MLTVSPTNRISAKESLEHPFFEHLKQQEKEKTQFLESNYLEKVKANLLEYNSL